MLRRAGSLRRGRSRGPDGGGAAGYGCSRGCFLKGSKGTFKTYGDACAGCFVILTPKNVKPRGGDRPNAVRSRCVTCDQMRAQSNQAKPKNRVAHNARCRANRLKVRRTILSAYGGKCSCCGEEREEFLALDHVNGGGSKQRKNGFSTSGSIYRYAIRMGFPPTFRLLCHNCNSALGWYGYCPHEKERNANR